MAQTKKGAAKVRKKYGNNFFKKAGAKGGRTTARRFFGKK